MRASLRQHNSPPIYLPSPPACPVVNLIHSDNATIHKTKNYGYCSPPSPPPTPPSSSCYKVWYPILYNNAPLSSCDLSRGNSKVGIISEQSKALYQNKKLQASYLEIFLSWNIKRSLSSWTQRKNLARMQYRKMFPWQNAFFCFLIMQGLAKAFALRYLIRSNQISHGSEAMILVDALKYCAKF